MQTGVQKGFCVETLSKTMLRVGDDGVGGEVFPKMRYEEMFRNLAYNRQYCNWSIVFSGLLVTFLVYWSDVGDLPILKVNSSLK